MRFPLQRNRYKMMKMYNNRVMIMKCSRYNALSLSSFHAVLNDDDDVLLASSHINHFISLY